MEIAKVTYQPVPVNTDDIKLGEELDSLIDALAENVHDQWSLGRIKAGWQYGPERNDEKKYHPCLVPYEELPDAEKKYDRDTAMETLKLIIKLGYVITKKEESK